MHRQLAFLFGLCLFILPVSAQFDTSDFRWELIDVAFSYPAHWDEPFAVQRFGIESVLMAESDVRDAERPLEIPTITVTIRPDDGTNLNLYLEDGLTELAIQPNITMPANLLDTDAILAQGVSRDELFFGMGIVASIDGNILMVDGHSPVEQSRQFKSIFDVVISSMVKGQIYGQSLPYGIVWDNFSEDITDDSPFTILEAIQLDETNQSIYGVDSTIGLLRFDMQSGRLQEVIPYQDFVTPQSIAIGAENTVYIADPDCPCIHVYQNNEWQDTLDGFLNGSPQYIATTSDGTLYATDTDNTNVFIRQYNAEGVSNLFSEEAFFEQPILFTVDGQLHAITAIDGQIQRLDEFGFTLINTLDLDFSPQHIDIALDGTYILTDDNMIHFYTPDSLLITSLDIRELSVGSAIQGLASDADSTLYVATRDIGAVELLAASQHVIDIGFGLQDLAPYRISGSFLNDDNKQDIWIFEGVQNEQVTIDVQGFSQERDFDFDITLIDPNGAVEARVTADSNPSVQWNRRFENFELSSTGIYTVQVNHINGQGSYNITLIKPTIVNHDTTLTTVWGNLPDSYFQESWQFEANAGDTLMLILRAVDPTQLDPYIRLYDTQRNLLAQNDDAQGTSGNTAQLTFTASRTGTYTIEAVKFEGSGQYNLTIETIEDN